MENLAVCLRALLFRPAVTDNWNQMAAMENLQPFLSGSMLQVRIVSKGNVAGVTNTGFPPLLLVFIDYIPEPVVDYFQFFHRAFFIIDANEIKYALFIVHCCQCGIK